MRQKADSRAEAGEAQERPGASCGVRKQGDAQEKIETCRKDTGVIFLLAKYGAILNSKIKNDISVL